MNKSDSAESAHVGGFADSRQNYYENEVRFL
jgi:hypothetical protein